MKSGTIIFILVASFIVGLITGIYMSKLLFPYYASYATMITVKDVQDFKFGMPIGIGFLFFSIALVAINEKLKGR